MTIIDKRTPTATKKFCDLPIGTVFEFPKGSEQAGWFGICMKIETADTKDNTFDIEDCTVFDTQAYTQVCELNAHLVIEGR